MPAIAQNGADLAQYGDWTPDPEYGDVWYPRAVAVGWVPYQNGHWAWVAPWGWTWVEYEPWGFAPFHYGRWAFFGTRWGWIPGPPPVIVGRPVPPVYSPALVAFVGGPGFSLSVGVGGGGPRNAGLLAVQILAVGDAALQEKYAAYKRGLVDKVMAKDAALRESLKQ